MAMVGRLRSSSSLLRKILEADSTLVRRGAGNPSTPLCQHLRNYATDKSSKEEIVKVPLSLFGVSGNYASALFLAASKTNLLDKVESELTKLVEASKSSPVFSQFIKDLSVLADVRVKAAQEIFSEAGFSDISKNFLATMAENGRLRYIEKIAKSFADLTMAYKGEVKVTVTTVIPLPAEEEKELKETLRDIIGRGKTVKVDQKHQNLPTVAAVAVERTIGSCIHASNLYNWKGQLWDTSGCKQVARKIDPSILGGLVVEFGQKVFDMSIKSRAKQMERYLREPINFQNF